MGTKYGPLPAWGWAVLIGGIGGLVWFLRRKPSGAADQAAAGVAASAADPTTIVPVNQGLGAEQAQAILDAIKELQGEESKEVDDDDDDEPKPKPSAPSPTPGPVFHPPPPHGPGIPARPPKPIPKPKPVPKPRKFVITKKWLPVRTPWQSTLWGIAQHYKTPGGWQRLQTINRMHGDPRTHLQPGVKVYLE